jgi:hypothetical protein
MFLRHKHLLRNGLLRSIRLSCRCPEARIPKFSACTTMSGRAPNLAQNSLSIQRICHNVRAHRFHQPSFLRRPGYTNHLVTRLHEYRIKRLPTAPLAPATPRKPRHERRRLDDHPAIVCSSARREGRLARADQSRCLGLWIKPKEVGFGCKRFLTAKSS